MSLQIRRGLEADRLSVTPLAGEFLYTTDEKKLYIGDGTTPGGNLVADIPTLSTRISDRGGYDASSNAFPTTGGTGAGGAIEQGNTWYITVAGTLGGVSVGVGSRIMAKQDAPTLDAHWLVTPVATAGGVGITYGTYAEKIMLPLAPGRTFWQTDEMEGLYVQTPSNKWVFHIPESLLVMINGNDHFTNHLAPSLANGGTVVTSSDTDQATIFKFSTGATSAAARSGAFVAGAAVSVIPTGNRMISVFDSRIVTEADLTNSYTLRFGIGASAIATSGTDAAGCYFRYSQATGIIQCVTRTAAGAEEVTNTTITGAQFLTRKRLVIAAHTTEVKFYCDGTLLATHTSNIPVGTVVIPWIACILKTLGTADRQVRFRKPLSYLAE